MLFLVQIRGSISEMKEYQQIQQQQQDTRWDWNWNNDDPTMIRNQTHYFWDRSGMY